MGPQRQGPLPVAQVPSAWGIERGVLGRPLERPESKGKAGKMAALRERLGTREGGRVRSRKDKINEIKEVEAESNGETELEAPKDGWGIQRRGGGALQNLESKQPILGLCSGRKYGKAEAKPHGAPMALWGVLCPTDSMAP